MGEEVVTAEGTSSLRECSSCCCTRLQPRSCPPSPHCIADDPLSPGDTLYSDCVPLPLFARPSVNLFVQSLGKLLVCQEAPINPDQLYLSDGWRKASAALAQNPKERKQAIFNDCIYCSLHCSPSVGNFLLLSLHSSSTCLSVSQMFFLDAPFTLLCFQQLPTLYVFVLFLLLK